MRRVGTPIIEIIERLFGGRTYTITNRYLVSPGSYKIATHNPNRVQLLVLNEGSVPARIGFDPTISSVSGFYLPPQGGILQFHVNEDGELTFVPLWSCAVGGDTYLLVVEVVRA